jgi:hypothetical protein
VRRWRQTAYGTYVVFGWVEIGEIDSESNLVAHEELRVRLRAEKAERLDFWRYYRNGDGDHPMWGTLLFRYLEDGQIHRILADISETVGESQTREIVDRLIVKHFGDGDAPPAKGALAKGESVARKAAIAHKYPGGEGPHHKALKYWIANNPASVGLPAKSVADVEHVFTSGDCVDIAFRLPGGNWAVVEIETTHPFPGAHQIIKYRALLAAQLGLALDTDRITGLLVAWDFEGADLDFCKDYGVRAWRCQTGNSGTRAFQA